MNISKKHACRNFLLGALIVCSHSFLQDGAIAQANKTDSLQELSWELKSLKERSSELESALAEQKQKGGEQDGQLKAQQVVLDSLQKQLDALRSSVRQASDALRSDVDTKHQAALSQVSNVSGELSDSRLVGLGLGLLIALSGGLGYIWLRKRQSKTEEVVAQKAEGLQQEITRSREELEAQIVGELAKQTQLLEQQSAKLQEDTKLNTSNGEQDHSLALKLAGEITTIERNVSLMDEGTRGLKQLQRSIAKLKDNLLANGYEMPELLHKKHVQGMNLIVVNTHHDENMEEGLEIITKVLVPQVNYQGKLIQSAQVELSIG